VNAQGSFPQGRRERLSVGSSVKSGVPPRATLLQALVRQVNNLEFRYAPRAPPDLQ